METSIDYIEQLLNDGTLVVVHTTSSDHQCTRLIGKIEENHWSRIYTLRNEEIRIISVRRSRDNEKAIYES